MYNIYLSSFSYLYFTIMFRIFHDTDIQKRISNPLHGDRDVVDGMQDNLGIQVFD